jgi:UDP-glucose:(heptosyl)LPS alpha-1,3-glucosyltransferase
LLMALNPLHHTILWLERQTYSPACTGRIIANSHRGKEEIVRHYAFPGECIDVVLNGVDAERFRPGARKSDGEFILLFVGSGFERKGLEFSIRVLPHLPGHVRLRVAGKGKREPYLRLAEKLGVRNRLEFLGGVARIEDVYAQGDLLLHPAMYEPFSNACLEALACGLPVVTSRINGASEVLTVGQDGSIVEDPGDMTALAEGIRIWLDPAKLAEGREQARASAMRNSFAENLEKTLEVIRACGRDPTQSPSTSA